MPQYGFLNLSKFLEYPEVECVALCDIDDEWLNKRSRRCRKKTGKKFLTCIRIGAMSSTTRISTLSLSVPPTTGTADYLRLPGWQRRVCRKPLSNTIEECNLMEKAARKYNRVVQVGQWQRSDPHWDEAANYLKGKYRPYPYRESLGLPGRQTDFCLLLPTVPSPPEWITTCGSVRLRNVRSISTASIITSVSSGIMPVD